MKPFFEENLLMQRHEISSHETRVSTLSYGRNPESLSHLGLNRYRVVTDGQTDGKNYDSYIYALSTIRAVARNNCSILRLFSTRQWGVVFRWRHNGTESLVHALSCPVTYSHNQSLSDVPPYSGSAVHLRIIPPRLRSPPRSCYQSVR